MRRSIWIALCLLLQGCPTLPPATMVKQNIPHHDFLASDSRLRVVVGSDQTFLSTSGLVNPNTIICTEPSPDVATTLANSLGLGASVAGQGSASVSSQRIEGLVQLGERTAAIQLLRDKMYQICLAYANGAISGTTYSLLMSRLDDSIITLSLGDGAARAFGSKSASVGGEASAKYGPSLLDLPGDVSGIDDQAKKLAEANKRVDDAASALKTHNVVTPAEGEKDKYKKDTTKLVTDLMTAKSERDAMVQIMQRSAKSASEASGETSQLQAGGGISATPHAEVLHEMQSDFLLTNIDRDLAFACMVELGLRGPDPENEQMIDLTQTMKGMCDTATIDYAKRYEQGKADDRMGEQLKKDIQTYCTNYANAVNRLRPTRLTAFCAEKLEALASEAAKQSTLRVQLNAQTAAARYAADTAKAFAEDKKLLGDSIRLCDSEFKDDKERRQACLDQVIHFKAAETGAKAEKKRYEK